MGAWSDRFAAFAARKTAAALSAHPAPYLTIAERPRPHLLAIGTPWSRAAFGGDFYVREPAVARPSLSLVFVRSADGNTGASDPATLGGGATDYHVVFEGLSRVLADAVLAGAGTVRSGNLVFSVWHPEMVDLRRRSGLGRHPIQIVTTKQGLDLARGVLFNAPELSLMLLTTSAGARAMDAQLAERPWIRTVVAGEPGGLAQAFAGLRAAGIQRISCIGGRLLAAELLAHDLVDDLYLTTSARPGGEPRTPLPAAAFEGDVVVEKQGTGEDRGVVFQHLAVRAARR